MGTGAGGWARQRDGKGRRDQGWPVTALLGLLLVSMLTSAGTLLIGCSVMRSDTLIDPATGSSPPGEGLAYSLTKGYLHVTITSTIDVMPVAEATSAELIASEDTANPKVTHFPVTSFTWTNSSSDGGATWKNAITLSGTNNGPAVPIYKSAELVRNVVYHISVAEDYRPDPAFLLNLKPNWASDDAVSVTLSNGFLSHIGSTNADQTGAIIQAMVQTAAQAFMLAAGFPAPEGGGEKAQMRAMSHLKLLAIDEEIDPGDPLSWQHFIDELTDGGLSVSLLSAASYRDVKTTTIEMVTNSADQTITTNTVTKTDTSHRQFPLNAPSSLTPKSGGIYYRPLRPYVMQFRATTGNERQITTHSQVVLLPQSEPVFYPFGRAAFVTNYTALDFQNGVLTSVSLVRPSSLLGAAKIPLEIVNDLVSIPTNLIQLKINTTKQNTDLDTARAAQLNAELALAQSNAAVALWTATNNAAKAEKTTP